MNAAAKPSGFKTGILNGGQPVCRYSGLSPRARGNPAGSAPSSPPSRSIPACAGEPVVRMLNDDPRKVYPRVRGGTSKPTVTEGADSGLSPRARGNPQSLDQVPP